MDRCHHGRWILSPVRHHYAETGLNWDQCPGELHAARPGSARQLLVAVDGSRQSCAIQRNVSSRIRALTDKHRLPLASCMGVATETIWNFRTDRVRVQPWGCWNSWSALAARRQSRWKT